MFCNEIRREIERDRVRGGGGCGGVVNLELFLFVVFSRRFGGVEAVESSLGFLAFVLENGQTRSRMSIIIRRLLVSRFLLFVKSFVTCRSSTR